MEHEHREIGEFTPSELARPAENSPRAARNALHTIERDTGVATGRMRALLPRAWLRLLTFGLSLWLGIFGGSWATMRWLRTRIPARIETDTNLDVDIEEARRTLVRMEVDTWRIALLKIEVEQAVVLSAGTLDKPRWTWRERPAARLSRE
ncbi:hypothetical protein [Candidatus Palauibacter sp.]|uniref:hypothetical protein n=1 Tax=Candidatus Palauibacter sp. TaxID=3101350 RepID=UPI003B52F130